MNLKIAWFFPSHKSSVENVEISLDFFGVLPNCDRFGTLQILDCLLMVLQHKKKPARNATTGVNVLGYFIVGLLGISPTLHARDLRSDAEIAKDIVENSRQAYYSTGHPCACPDDRMRNGRTCGNVSAYIRPGGAQPLCYVTDVTPGMISDYRARH
jgi:hypothetical protein